jgi:hypothetical protein
VYDIDSLLQDGEVLLVTAEGVAGAYAYKAPDSEVLSTTDARQVDVAMDSAGVMYMATVDNNEVWLYWGEPRTGLSSVKLDPALTAPDDLDIHVTVDDQLVLAVRDGDDLTYAVLDL